jgi:hypothetical protein
MRMPPMSVSFISYAPKGAPSRPLRVSSAGPR